MREAKRNCLSEKGREYRGSNAVYNGRSFGARVWTGENNSEQHSCPTRLNSSLQLHFPCIRLLPLIYSVLSHSPLSSVLFTTTDARSAVSFIFYAAVAIAASSKQVCMSTSFYRATTARSCNPS